MNKLKLAILLSILLLSSMTAAQPSVSPECREEFQDLDKSMSEELEQAESDEERNEIRRRYESKMEELEEECLRQSEDQEEEKTSSSGDRQRSDRRLERTGDLRNARPEEVSDEKCRERTEKLKEKYIKEIKKSTGSELLDVIERFGEQTAEELNRCGAGPTSGGSEGNNAEHSELSISLGEGIPDECRSNVEGLKEKYEQKLSDAEADKKDKILEKYNAEVEKRLESCNTDKRIIKQGQDGLQLPNVSEAPEEIPEKCREKVSKLNEKVRKEMENADNKTRVREKYKSEYKTAMRGCMKNMVVKKTKNEIASNLMDKLPIGSNQEEDLNQSLQRKNEKIEELQERVERLEQRLSDQENLDKSGFSNSSNYSNNSHQDKPTERDEEIEDREMPDVETDSQRGKSANPVKKVLSSILG